MSIERFPEKMQQIYNRVALARGRGEEATKQALVLPFLDALGYDVWNPSEVCPEYEADFAVKKAGQREKVDLAIVLQNEPRVFIEVKSVDTSLDGHEGQLARYFNGVPSVSLGILTNGYEYRFYTDASEPNLLDKKPFFSFKMDSVDLNLDVLARFHRSSFSPAAIRDYATELAFTDRIVAFLRGELDLRGRDPGDNFIRWVLSSAEVHEGRMVASVIERFRPIIKNSLQAVLKEIVRRSVAALDDGVTAAEPESRPVTDPPEPTSPQPTQGESDAAQDAPERPGVFTTDEELSAFSILKGQFDNSALANSMIYDSTTKKDTPIEVCYRDTTGYFSVAFNNPRWWFARLNLDGKTRWIGFNLPTEEAAALLPKGFTMLTSSQFAVSRVAINSVHDLHALHRLIFLAMQRLVEERRAKADTAS